MWTAIDSGGTRVIMSIDPVFQLAAALTLALVFGGGALSKMSAWAELEGVVANFRVLPRSLVPAATWILPPVELALAFGVLVPATRVPAALVMAALLAAFALAIAINIGRGRIDIDCGCFRSSLKQNLSWWLVLRNAVLIVVAVTCLLSPVARGLGWADNFVAVMAGLAVFIAYLSVGYVTLRVPPTYEDNYERALAQRT